jgi:hypothetical protein
MVMEILLEFKVCPSPLLFFSDISGPLTSDIKTTDSHSAASRSPELWTWDGGDSQSDLHGFLAEPWTTGVSCKIL